MNRKIMIGSAIAIMIILILFIMFNNNKKNMRDVQLEKSSSEVDVSVEHEENDREYRVVDNNTGEILYTSLDLSAAEEWEDFYKRNPDYKSILLESQDYDSQLALEEFIEE